MTLEPGAKVWIPCDVRPSVFPDERLVRIESATESWDGFLDVRQLRDQIEEGRTAVAATVVEASHGRVSVQLPGQVTRGPFMSGPEAQFERLVRT
jgi:hypothetical protein